MLFARAYMISNQSSLTLSYPHKFRQLISF